MRLPYLQVDSDAWGKARVLAALLGCDRHRAMSCQMDLWVWALERGDGMPDGLVVGNNPSVQLAGAVEWTGKAQELADALVEAGLLAVVDGGYRVRGLSRYESTFERQEADRQRKAEARAKKAGKGESEPVRKASSGSPQDVQRTSSGSPADKVRTSAVRPQDVQRKSEEVRSIDVDVDVDAKQQTTSPLVRVDAVSLRDRLSQAFAELRGGTYAYTFDDEQAGKRLLQLAQGNEDEIIRRWRNALKRQRFPMCDSLKDLAKHWNAYVQEAQAPQPQGGGFARKESPYTRPGGVDGVTRPPKAEGAPCGWVDLAVKGCTGVGVEDSGGQWLCPACLDVSKSYWDKEAAKLSDAELAEVRRQIR